MQHSLGQLGTLLISITAFVTVHAQAKQQTIGADAVSGSEAAKSTDPESLTSVTGHSIRVNGTLLKYHARAGFLVLTEEEGKPLVPENAQYVVKEDKQSDSATKSKDDLKRKAKMFFVAYTLDNHTDPSSRPVTFVFNGGPGSSSVWLHMGSVAPRRVALTVDGESPPPPYKLVDNETTWLDSTDLVFIDPVSTGYSRPMPKEDPRQFHGLKEDIASMADFIRVYTSRNERWLSPKFLLGESYGTTRAAGLSDYLQDRYGLYLNGIILVSTALNIQPLLFTPQNTDTYISFIPTYATAAWYHHRLSPQLQSKSVEEVAAEARAFAGNEYRLALVRGDTLSIEEKGRVAAELARLTGIPAAEFEASNLRMKESAFVTHLLRGARRLVGSMDARFTGLPYAPGEDGAEEYDPSDGATEGSFTAAFNDYVRRELKFELDIPYETYADVHPWNFGDARNGFPNTAEALRRVMIRNPYLQVWIVCGYYDLLTPFFAAENVIAGLNLERVRRANVRFTYYPAGHMPYLHEPSRVKFKSDFLTFVHDATQQAVVHTAARHPPEG